ncbi:MULTISPECIES: CheR family methyltransferase [Sphingomonadales]|uniref:protein-glutamate O-methyltransferase n=1 Tax=Edaphosphingomonas haloaromaticamans TaxID=653954 RepID=A0A1S1HF55_9SPHN|nr:MULTISPECIES: CheR family methyltransferase [Sphingomonas]AGH48295.1 MCP methyltransferase, CheR-type [Sphingomonas sp. MM-1]OHT20767.1 Chemotaxis protein methyltransferase [Sphingomonas haloaromaticamans]
MFRKSSGGGPALSPADFAAIATLAHSHAGIVLGPEKAASVAVRLSARLRARGCEVFADYVALIRTDSEERALAIETLADTETAFFRDDGHFRHVAEHLRPAILDRVARGDRVRLWSAGCATGEEAYSLALALLGPASADARAILDGDVLILATDLSRQALDAARRGLYPAAANIPPPLRAAWTAAVPAGIEIREAVRNLIRFRQLNLLNAWPVSGLFDAILCRNVMPDFDEPTRQRLIGRLADQIVPGGHLYIGADETLAGPAADRFAPAGQGIFRKRA